MPAQSKSQRRLFGWARGVQKGTANNAPDSVQRLAKDMKPSVLNHYAKTPEKGIPNRVKKEGYARGFLKAAQQEGLSGQDLFDLMKYGSPGMMPTLMGAIPGAALGGYIGYDRALDGQKKEELPEEGAPEIAEEGEVPPVPPQASGPSPGMSGLVGALLGAGAGGLAGAGAGAVGWERGVNDLADHNKGLLQALNAQYAGA